MQTKKTIAKAQEALDKAKMMEKNSGKKPVFLKQGTSYDPKGPRL